MKEPTLPFTTVSRDMRFRIGKTSWQTWVDGDGKLAFATSRARPIPADDLDPLVREKLQFALDRVYEKVA